VLQSNVHLCVSACGLAEDVVHLFLFCDYFENFWHDISNWVGFSSVRPAHFDQHLFQFGALGGFPRSTRSTLHLIFFMRLSYLARTEL